MKKIKKILLIMLKEQSPGQAERLMAAIEADFARMQLDIAFAKKSKNPLDRRLPVAAYLLALIKVLKKSGWDYQQIRELVLAMAVKMSQPQNLLQQWLKNSAATLVTSRLGRYLLARMNKNLKETDPGGFVVSILTDKKETYGLGYGLDIHQCGICHLFQKHHFQEFTPLLCEVDYITSSMAGLQLVRQGTIANGAEKCDFRFKKN